MRVFIYHIKTRLNFTSNFFLDQNNPNLNLKSKNELIYIRDFEAVQKTSRSVLLSGLKTVGLAPS